MDRKETFTGVSLLNKIRFKPADGGRRRKYRPHELARYQRGKVIYESLPIRPHGLSLLNAYYEINPSEGEWTFLRLISEGTLNHYQLEWADHDNGTISSIDLFHRKYEAILVRATQGIFGLKRKNLINYFQDCPALQQNIEQKAFKYPSEVTHFYNKQCDAAK